MVELGSTNTLFSLPQNQTHMRSLFVAVLLVFGLVLQAQTLVSEANYALAARFSPKKLEKLVLATYSAQV